MCIKYILVIGICMCINHIKTYVFLLRYFVMISSEVPVPVAAQSKAWIYGRLLGLRVRIPPAVWMSVSCVCVLSGRGICEGLIIRPEKSY
jgi:hypothetical protein